MTKDTGGPAFPFTCEKYYSEGMTLRDYFASKAMQGQLSMPEVLIALSTGDTTIAALCGSCFEWADAMLKARQT
jgi:hypothetical protein